MFFDGAVLEVDVQNEMVEFARENGESERYADHVFPCRRCDFNTLFYLRLTVRDCHIHRMVGERMKAFEDFVSLFDDSEQ